MTQTELRGPYAPVQNVLDVIRRMMDRGLPERVDLGTLQAIGIAEGNAPRTLAALKFLGLVGDDDRRTNLFDRLGRASTDEYPAIFGEIIREAYALVFTLVDPAQDNEIKIADAFRQYEPGGQRQRMVTLFLGLCEEAGITEAGKKAPRQAVPARAGRANNGNGATNKGKGGSVRGQRHNEPPPATPVGLLFGVSESDVAALSDSDFDIVWAALGKVARARARVVTQAQPAAIATDDEATNGPDTLDDLPFE